MHRFKIGVVLLIGIFISIPTLAMKTDEDINKLFTDTGIDDKLDWDIFRLSMIGYNKLLEEEKIKDPTVITIIDFSKPSTEERLFVVDLDEKKILHSSLVAHGKNSGWDIPDKFSNISGSLMSSLGFFLTTETYYGKHGYSLKLKGLDSPFNDRAEDRAIVIHKAGYVSKKFIEKYGRLGRSWGCPALPVKTAATIIDEIKSGTCLFIYADNENYLKKSKILNQDTAVSNQ